MKKPARKTREGDAALYANEERNAVRAELEREGWEIRQTGYNTHVTYKDGMGSTGTFPTRDEAIDYALQLAHKEEK